MEGVSLVSVRHNGNTKDLLRSGIPKLWDTENIRRDLEEKLQKKVLVDCQKNLGHKNIRYIAILRNLPNHTEALDLYFMN